MRAACATAFVVLALLSGCDTRDRWALPQGFAQPTALDYWQQGRVFVVGSYHDGRLLHLAADGGHTIMPAMNAQTDGRRRAIRLKVDAQRNRLWVLDLDAVYLYALREQTLMQRVDVPAARLSSRFCLPDMTLDTTSGAVYVSHNERPELHRIEHNGNDDRLRVVRLPVRDAAGREIREGFSALTMMRDARALVAGSASSGKLWRIDPESGQAVVIPSGVLRGACGIAAHPPDSPPLYHQIGRPILYVTLATGHEVRKVSIAQDWRSARISRIAPLLPVQSPVSLVAFSTFIVVAGSGLFVEGNGAGEYAPRAPYRLVLMPSGLEAMVEIRSSR